jgi:hypothetical protein
LTVALNLTHLTSSHEESVQDCSHFANTYFAFALALWPQGAMLKRYWQGSASAKAASKTATFRSLRSPSIGSAYAIGGHTTARAVCARVLHIRALLAAGTLNLSNK